MQADALNCMFLVTDTRVYHVFRTKKTYPASRVLPAVFSLQRKTCKVTQRLLFMITLKENKFQVKEQQQRTFYPCTQLLNIYMCG